MTAFDSFEVKKLTAQNGVQSTDNGDNKPKEDIPVEVQTQNIVLPQTNEDDYIEMSDEFEEEIVSDIDEKMPDIDEISYAEDEINIDDEEINNEELNETSDKKDAAIEDENINLPEDNEENNNEETNDGTTLSDFKKLMSKDEKLDELISNYGYDKVFELFDKDNDGKITSEDIKEINSTCESLSDFTYGEIKKYIENNIEENEEDEEDSINEENFDDIVEKLKNVFADEAQNEQTQTPVQQTPAYSSGGGGYSGGGGSYSSGGSSSSGGGGSTTGVDGAGAATESLEDSIAKLEEQKSVKEGELSDLNGELNAVYDGTDEEVSAAQDELDEAKAEYEDCMDDEIEKNPEIKQLKEEQEAKEKEIEDKTKEIDETELSISEKEQEITSKESEISGLESDLAALESSLSALDSIEITDNNKDDVEAKRSDLNSQIKAKKDEIQNAKDEKTALEEEKSDLENDLDKFKDEKTALEEELEEIENNIKDSVSEKTKQALEAYQQARDNVEDIKAQRSEAINNDISTKQTEITEIDNQIAQLKAEQIQKENSLDPMMQYNEERGQALADAANSLYGGVSSGGGWCARGVSQAINKAFGYSTSGNGCDYGDTLSALDDWVEVTDSYESAADLVNLPAGAVVSWSPYNTTSLGNTYGHVYISDGEGHEISDFKSDITTYYADRGSEYRVFIPV